MGGFTGNLSDLNRVLVRVFPIGAVFHRAFNFLSKGFVGLLFISVSASRVERRPPVYQLPSFKASMLGSRRTKINPMKRGGFVNQGLCWGSKLRRGASSFRVCLTGPRIRGHSREVIRRLTKVHCVFS